MSTRSLITSGSYIRGKRLNFSNTASPPPFGLVSAQALIVAGGGGGGHDFGGGGGAGGLISNSNLSILTTSSYVITIGAGGAGPASYGVAPSAGSNTTAFGYTAIGGGGGAGTATPGYNATSGGSGGGAPGNGGTGTRGLGTAGQGNDGGTATGAGGASTASGGGGGGGAGAAGTNATRAQAGNGGAGIYSSISGSNTAYAGGGGGGGYSPYTALAGTGGAGGGGSGNTSSNGSGAPGTAFTGGGGGGGAGGGGGTNSAASGGSGVVVINYSAPQQFTGGTVTNVNNAAGSNIVHTFYASGTLNALATPIDTYFPQTTLLLHGDGTSGANNTVFLDSSPNNFTITTNGKLPQGTFSPFSQTGWSNYSSAFGSYLLAADNGGLTLGTSDFTMEAWVFLNSYNTNQSTIVGKWSSGTTRSWMLGVSSTGSINFFYNSSGSFSTSSSSVPLNTWTHVAVSRSGSNLYFFVNGILIQTSNISTTNISATNTSICIFDNYEAAVGSINTYFLNGYISNLRIVNGTALYTSNFNPSRTPLTAVSGTALLMCQDNRFKENSTYNSSITTAGSVAVQPFSPFPPTSTHSNTAVGGSISFNGSSNYLTVASNVALYFTADFTVECWAYATATTFSVDQVFNYGNWTFMLYHNGSTWTVEVGSGSSTYFTLSGTASLNAWHHFAITRSGNTYNFWINGVSAATTTNSNAPNTSGATLSIGRSQSGTEYFTGYISNLRMVKGTALYTAAFTPPSAPLTAITNTSLLLNATNAGIIDHTAKNTLTTYGSAAISSTQSKFGGTSMYFDGSTGYVRIPSNAINTIGTSDFTIEFWAYTTVGSQTNILYEQRSLGTQVTPTIYLNAGALNYYVNGVGVITGATFPTSQWNHVAVCRSSGSTKMFLNGTQTGSTYSDTNSYITEQIVLGAYFNGGPNSYFNGYIDEVRVSKYARYTTNFTPPTSAFLNQ